MKRIFVAISSIAVLAICVCGSASAQTTANVTFQVDMRAQITGGTFNPAGGDFVEIAGSMNNWQNPPADTLTDDDADSVYTKTLALDGTVGTTVHEWKFLQRTAGGDFWEDKLPGNRKLAHPAADSTLPEVVFDVPYPNTANVTFQLDMSVQIDKGNFNPSAGDSVEVAGSFNSFGDPPSAFLADDDGDSVYTATFALDGTVGQTVHEYKYLQRRAVGSDVWESDPNRTLDHPGDNTILDPVFWDDDPGLQTAMVNVTFQVDMSVKMQEPEVSNEGNVFNPAFDIVEVAGSFNEFQNPPADTLKDADGDSIYTATITLDGTPGFTVHQFKHLIRSPSGDLWEDNLAGNRTLTHPSQDTTLGPVFWDDDTIVSLPASGNILFQVDAAVLQDIGFIRREAGDFMWVLGSFTGWEGALDDPAREFVMARIPPGETHQFLHSHDGLTGDQLPYKFYIEWADSAFYANQYNRPWDANFGWEEPATLGGSDRRHTFVDGNQVGRQGFWGDLPPQGIVPAGDTVTVTMHVDMNPAIGPGGFDPATDTVYFHSRASILAVMLGIPHNAADSSKVFTDDNADNIFDLTFDIIGPAPYVLQYVYQYGTTADDHGFAPLGRHRVRYIQPIVNGQFAKVANSFPRTYEFPSDTWNPSPGPPHVIEEPPFSPTTSVERISNSGIPQEYALGNNYPNPFNPSTTIEFGLSKAGFVSIAIYNVLGQRIRTLTDKYFDQPGNYKVEWNGRDGVGRQVGTGVYFYRLKAGDTVLKKKMMLLK
ncbi:MAG: T9SS type A sorting domain-containing protein [bacterium]